ncbi:MAG: hypothetical protein ABFD50_02045 [Smithella sp.]
MLKKLALVTSIIILCMSSFSLAEVKKEEKKDLDKLMANVPGDSIDSSIHIFHQGIMFRYPKEWGWNPVYKNEKANHFIIEWIPRGQSLSTWKDMFTIQGFNNLAKSKDMSAERMMKGLKQRYALLAPASSYFQEIYKGDVNGYSGTIALMGIKEMPAGMNPTLPKGVGEIGLYLFLKGDSDMYLIHRSWKTDVPYTNEKLPMSEKELTRWVRLLKQVKLIQI